MCRMIPKSLKQSPQLGTKGLLEGKDDIDDIVLVPGRAKDPVGRAQNREILNHFLAQVVVDVVDLIMAEQGGNVGGQFVGLLGSS